MHHTTWVVGWSGHFRLLAWTVEAVGKRGEGEGKLYATPEVWKESEL